MSVITPNETAASWRAHRREAAVQLFLSGADGDAVPIIRDYIADDEKALAARGF